MSVGAIMLHLLLYRNVTAPIRHLHRIYDEHNEAVVFAGGYFDLLEAKSSLETSQAVSEGLVGGDVEIKNITFGYLEKEPILHNVSLRIEQGKTTVANLITRFYDPWEGEITIGGKNIKDFPLNILRESIGMVLQENHIFDGSIADNTRYGDLAATDSLVKKAIVKAGLEEIVKRSYDGLSSPAQRLSGGQKQRLALARVFLKDPPILILDEPTASLDAIATEKIKKALDEVRKS